MQGDEGRERFAHGVPDVMEAALTMVREFLKHDEAALPCGDDPFGNTGSRFENAVFKVHAYSWHDEEQPFNFAWRDLKIRWYKYFGRGMEANMEVTPLMARQCLEECLATLSWTKKD